MIQVKYILLYLCVFLLISCEGQTGYIDENQLSKVSKLTDAEWLVAYCESPLGEIETFDDETIVYRFERSGNGWSARGSFDDETRKENVWNFKWTFTTEHFAVLYITGSQNGGFWEEYWLIEKLTRDDLWVQIAAKDPAIYPNQLSRRYRLKAKINQ